MSDDYERGYQDGQADIEEEILNAFLGVYSVDLRLDTVLGHETATVTIHTTRDSALYGFLQRHISRLATESVDGLGDQMLNSHKTDQKPTEREIHLAKTLEKIEEMFGPNGTHRHQVTGATMSDELTV